MKTTVEFFNMNKEELTKVVNEYGYTKEECKLFDSSAKTILLAGDTPKEEIQDTIQWYRVVSRFEFSEMLQLTDNRIALLLD